MLPVRWPLARVRVSVCVEVPCSKARFQERRSISCRNAFPQVVVKRAGTQQRWQVRGDLSREFIVWRIRTFAEMFAIDVAINNLICEFNRCSLCWEFSERLRKDADNGGYRC